MLFRNKKPKGGTSMGSEKKAVPDTQPAPTNTSHLSWMRSKCPTLGTVMSVGAAAATMGAIIAGTYKYGLSCSQGYSTVTNGDTQCSFDRSRGSQLSPFKESLKDDDSAAPRASSYKTSDFQSPMTANTAGNSSVVAPESSETRATGGSIDPLLTSNGSSQWLGRRLAMKRDG